MEDITVRDNSSSAKPPTTRGTPRSISIEDLELAKEEATKSLAILPVIIEALEELIEWKESSRREVEKRENPWKGRKHGGI